MPTNLSVMANEESTFAIVATFTDEEGEPMTPNSGLTWTLTGPVGAIINSREDVAIASAASVTVVLSGADLDVSDGSRRYLVFKGTYDSDLGSNLPIKDQVNFSIHDLAAT